MTDWAPDVEQDVTSELPPFGIKPHWVTFGFSTRANHLYDLYNAHVNQDRKDGKAWPTLDDLAEPLGLSRGDKVTPYMRELEEGGAISVETFTKTGGKGRRYVVTVKQQPPAGFTGPMQSSDWHDVKKTKIAGQEVHPPQGGYVHPFQRGDVHPPQGVVTNNKLNQNQLNQNQDEAPSARSASDARRATTGSSAREKSGFAASGSATAPKKSPAKLTRRQAQALRTIEAAYPAELKALMPKYRPQVVREALLDALGEGTQRERTAEQVAARVDRRWYTWGFSRRSDTETGGEGLRSGVGALVTVLATGDCPHPRCEDGVIVDTDDPCSACRERKEDRRAAHRRRTGSGGRKLVPAPRKASGSVWWTCADCRAPGKGDGPADSLCRECRTQGAAALAARLRLEQRWHEQDQEAAARHKRIIKTYRHTGSDTWAPSDAEELIALNPEGGPRQ